MAKRSDLYDITEVNTRLKRLEFLRFRMVESESMLPCGITENVNLQVNIVSECVDLPGWGDEENLPVCKQIAKLLLKLVDAKIAAAKEELKELGVDVDDD